MNNEFKKMQKLAGLITENQYEADSYEASNIIDNIISKELKDNFIDSVEAIKSAVEAAGNKDIDRGDVYDYLLMMMEEDD
jgi:hypothetical protein